MAFRKRCEDDFEAEIRAHIRLEADRLIDEGMPPGEAERAARRAFGNVTMAQERFYESQRWTWFEQLRQDLRYGVRSLWKTRAFALAAAASIALGLGANTAMFSLADAVLLRSLPVENPKELVFITAAGSEGKSGPPPYPYFSRLRSQTRTCREFAAFASDELRVEIDGRPEQVMGQVVSGNYFELLGIKPLLGRVLTPNDEALDPAVAVISERYWRRRFGADPTVIGRTLTIGTRPFVVIGVTPGEFFGLQPGSAVDVSIPITTERDLIASATAVWLTGIVARLKPGVPATQVRAEADALYRSFMASSRYPREMLNRYFHHIEVEPAAQGLDSLRRRFSQPLHVLMAIAGVMLLLVVANIANLLLARGIGRAREFAIRLASGANQARIARQVLTETAVLFCAGAVPAVACAHWGVGAIEAVLREGRRGVDVDANLNWRVLAFSLLITLVAALAAGLFPAWRAFRTDPEQAMKEGQARTGESRGGGRMAQALVAFQVGLSLILLVGAVLFTTTLRSLEHMNPGFRSDAVLTMSIQAPDGYEGGRLTALWMRSVEAVRQVPGVRSAGVSTYTPLSGRDRGAMVRIRGYEPSSPEDATVHTNQVSDGYFESMGIALVRGRLLTDQDTDGTPKVAVINETGARKFFGRRDPVGEMVTFTRKGEDSSYRIVGVVQDTRHMSLREAPQRFVFVPLRQPRDVDRRVTLVVASRTPGRTLDLLAPVRRSLAGVEPGILVSDVTTMQNQLKNTLVTERLLSGLSNVFGALAMIVAGIGLYGVLSYRVGRQRNGIAIRMALGASPASVGIGVLRQSGLAIAFGLCAGLPFAVMGARLAQNMIWGVKAGDFRVYAGCVAALCLVGLLSAGLPARRAATIQPLEALRHD